MNSILIVDDEKSIRHAFVKALEQESYIVSEADHGAAAIRIAKEEAPDLILLDVKLPDMFGLDVLKEIKKYSPASSVILMTAFGDIELAVEAMQLGADNFRTKPFNVSEMKLCILKTLESRKSRQELESYRSAEKQKCSVQPMIGESKAIHDIQEMIQKIAVSFSTSVLIQGPSGVGKELVARAIHYASQRNNRRFLEVNCTAIPESLLESELFGHEKGSFTDAKKEHLGIFEQADGGTLFLDEVGDMSLSMQAKLLRALQEKRFKRIGGTKDIRVDVRVIASTNVDLAQAVKDGKFREDLYYRLKVIPLDLPPLKYRDRDALLIAHYYLKQFCREFKKSFQGFTPEAEFAILTYEWPGNIRELKNVMERATLLENGEYLTSAHLNLGVSDSHTGAEETLSYKHEKHHEAGLSLRIPSFQIEDVEKALIQHTLIQSDWNRNTVAKIIGINRATLYGKIKKYGLEKL
jgi:DNA-binding NtrC family response regulator